MGILSRIFKIGQSETHAALDKLENPIRLTEQGIRDLKEDLDKALHALAEVKAMAIRAKNDVASNKAKASDYEHKAMLLLQRAEKGELDPSEADRLASEALLRKKEVEEIYAQTEKEQERSEASVAKLESGIKNIRSNIAKWENELKTLKARAKVSNATKNINKQLANVDSSSTVSMLERMKEKVAQDEALAESYGEIANESKTVDDEIDKALEGSVKAESANDLAALKAKMGLDKKGE